MNLAYLPFSRLAVLSLTMAAAACSGSSNKSNPDAQPDANSAIDATIDNQPVSASLDGGGESLGEVGQTSKIKVSPSNIDLGTVQLGIASPMQTITITATDDIDDLKVSLVGSELRREVPTTCGLTLAAGTSCVVVLTFLSPTLGAKSDSVVIVTGGQTTSVPITATVQVGAHLMISPDSAQTFTTTVGVPSAAATFAVANSGDTEVGPVAAAITGADADDFTFTATGCDHLASLAGCTIAVVWTPRAVRTSNETATLVVTGPSPDLLTATVSLVGVGCLCPSPTTITPSASDLGSVAVGTTGPSVTYTVTNSSSIAQGPFTIDLSNSEFVLTSETCSTTVLSAGGTCNLGIALRPSSTGDKSATLTVTPTSGSPAAKTLTGTGVSVVDGGDLTVDGGSG